MRECLYSEANAIKETCLTTSTTLHEHLPGVFSKVPHMLESCLCASLSRGADIRTLRLVSKDLARIALRAVRKCLVQLGEGACPDPQQLTQLMGTTILRSMDLVVIIRAGECVRVLLSEYLITLT